MGTELKNVIDSEAELLAQPEEEYMSPAQLGFFKRRLLELEQELRANAGETTEHLRETSLVPEPIGLQRLLARPTATLSVEAQQRRELRQRQFGD